MNTIQRLAACAALTCGASFATGAVADDHPYSEGPVVNISAIRTEYGKFEDYMKYLDTTWKQTMEASKKAGYIISYQILNVEPRTENDPDLYLITTYKNWAALDGATAKSDIIAKQVEGSIEASNKGASDRGKIRRVLGSWTTQDLKLK